VWLDSEVADDETTDSHATVDDAISEDVTIVTIQPTTSGATCVVSDVSPEILPSSSCSQQPELHLLFQADPSAAIAIARKMEMVSQLAEAGEACMMVLEVVDLTHADRLQQGNCIQWKTKYATSDWGNTISSIKECIPSFLSYLEDRRQQIHKFNEQRKRAHPIHPGSQVSHPIPRVDRANIGPQNIPAKVLSTKRGGSILCLQTSAGIIKNGIGA
jgi:hypothetical protein